MPLRNKNSGVAACALLALTMSLTGCENVPWNPERWGADRIDVLSTEGRTGSAPMNYETLMRLGAAARAGGDLPNALAFEQTPNDPKLLMLIGVADDFIDQHAEAQARYRRGLELAPGDPGLSLNLALSLALIGDYDQAITRLQPLAAGPSATSRERQTLALIYGLKGDRVAATKLASMDLEPAAVQHNLAAYDTLRRLSPEARSRAIRGLVSGAASPSAS
jgi:Flp pilus assembly protein TadD